MKNVTPSPGQAWESNNVNKIIDEVTPSRVFYNGDCWESYNGFIIDNIFIPQSDLEWLAVNVDNIPESWQWIHKKFNASCFTNMLMVGSYSRKQWQNMRYDLGLDDKPTSSEEKALRLIAKAGISAQDAMRAFTTLRQITQKETKMTTIDLSTDEINDEFVMRNGDVVKLAAKGRNYAAKTSDGILSLHKKNGKCDEYKAGSTNLETDYDIVSKHDPRHWLKDLPDADLFKLYQTSDIVCNQFGVWVANSLGAPTLTLSGNKMPKLTGDEWKLSKISIPDLKAWQEQQVK